MPTPWILRPIRTTDDAAVAAIIRDVMTEHRCTGEGFAIHDPEVAAMAAAYAAPDARYYVVELGGEVLGGAGFARLTGTSSAAATCELRKMYFRPMARGQGLGRAMLELLLAEMKVAGYQRCYLETTSWMDDARRLYAAAGFTPLCGPLGRTGHHGCDMFFARSI
ncbi:MAG: GNAT family N-acetyltransferase [Planctomycetes bacterium]|nr:GNAT family N-acetyltransferase [Planctomycetota bacterium]